VSLYLPFSAPTTKLVHPYLLPGSLQLYNTMSGKDSGAPPMANLVPASARSLAYTAVEALWTACFVMTHTASASCSTCVWLDQISCKLVHSALGFHMHTLWGSHLGTRLHAHTKTCKDVTLHSWLLLQELSGILC